MFLHEWCLYCKVLVNSYVQKISSTKKNTSTNRHCTPLQKQLPVDVNFRSGRQGVFCKKVALKNFAKLTGKHLCQSLFFDKVARLKSATLLKKRLWHGCFPMNFAKFLATRFLKEHFRWLLLWIVRELLSFL